MAEDQNSFLGISQIHQEIEKTSKNLREWKCQLNFNQAPTDSDEPEIVDLCKYLLPPPSQDPSFPTGSNYVFPSHYTGEELRNRLVAELKIAAIQCGYSLIISTSKSRPTTKDSQRGYQIRMACKHSIPFNAQKDTTIVSDNFSHASSRVTYTQRQLCTQDTCAFSFVVFMQSANATLHPQRWFLAYKKGLEQILLSNFHKNHFKLDPFLITASSTLLSEEEKKLLQHCGQLYMSSPLTCALLSQSNTETSGIGWTSKQIYWMTYKERQEIAGLEKDASSAEKLIKSFENR